METKSKSGVSGAMPMIYTPFWALNSLMPLFYAVPQKKIVSKMM